MKRILICGDSFAADWTVKHPGKGWPNMLADTHEVTNIARAGVSEYKIHQQLESVNLFDFHVIIIAHTSPYRLYVKQHPIHSTDVLHSDCDFIYNDIKANEDQYPELGSIVDYFEKYFDQDYAKFVHSLICEKIEKMVDGCRVIHLINFEDQYKFKNSMDFTSVFKTNRGLMNHFDEDGNKYVYQRLIRRISEL
jgi:hypothetical protein